MFNIEVDADALRDVQRAIGHMISNIEYVQRTGHEAPGIYA